MISQIIAEVELNVKNILNNFKSLLKKYLKKNGRKISKKKKYQINYFRAELRKKGRELLRLKVKKKIDF